MTDSFVNPWRGKAFPRNPIPGQMFYLDVPNVNDPPPGWYEFVTSLGTPNAAGSWTLVNRATGDRGDIVRPAVSRERH